MENIMELFKAMVANVAQLQAQLQDAQSILEKVAQEAYEKGLAEGKASMANTSDSKLYDQAELDAKVEAAVSAATTELSAKVTTLEAEMVAVKSELESAKADVAAKILEAVKAREIEIAADIENTQVDNMALVSKLRGQA